MKQIDCYVNEESLELDREERIGEIYPEHCQHSTFNSFWQRECKSIKDIASDDLGDTNVVIMTFWERLHLPVTTSS